MVTNRSNFEDDVWDFGDEHKVASASATRRKMVFDGVWKRNPDLTHSAKHYLWLRKQGDAKHKPCVWSSLRTMLQSLTKLAYWLEQHGFQRWDKPNLSDWHKCYADIICTSTQAKSLCSALRGMAALAPMGPIKEPLAGIRVNTRDKSNRTQPYTLQTLRTFGSIFLKYERHLGDLETMCTQLKDSGIRSWDGTVLGIRGKKDLMRELGFARMSAMFMVMLATGMRLSEILSVERNCLFFDQQLNGWFVRGTVFKFHGGGKVTVWSCGQMGQRAVNFLQRLGFCGTKLIVSWEGKTPLRSLDRTAQRFVSVFSLEENGVRLHLHMHRFRKSFAQQVFQTTKVGLLAIRDQMKHRSATMTDRYVSNDLALHDHLQDQAQRPVSEFQQTLKQELGFSDEMPNKT